LGECVRWHRMAAEQGYAEAQNALAELHRLGTGVEKNLVEALRLHELAAEQGHTQSWAQVEQIQVLKCVPPRTSRVEGWSEHLNTAWNLMFDELRTFKDSEGHCKVPQRYSDNPKLGKWVSKQRQTRLKISKERASKLDSIGFTWGNVPDVQWKIMFEELRKFKERESHCNVPQRYSDNPKLGRWVMNQRAKRSKISKERASKLDFIGFT